MYKWRDILAGAVVDMGGKPFTVEKIKVKGKAVKVTVTSKAGTFTRELKGKAEVALYAELYKATPVRSLRPSSPSSAPVEAEVSGGPLHDASGRQRRWAEPGEGVVLEAPAPAKGGDWSAPKSKAEATVAGILGAVLVGESTDTASGWYVPPVDPSTIAGHLMLFHELTPESVDWAVLAQMHNDQHARALVAPFTTLHVNHWHTEQRPSR